MHSILRTTISVVHTRHCVGPAMEAGITEHVWDIEELRMAARNTASKRFQTPASVGGDRRQVEAVIAIQLRDQPRNAPRPQDSNHLQGRRRFQEDQPDRRKPKRRSTRNRKRAKGSGSVHSPGGSFSFWPQAQGTVSDCRVGQKHANETGK